MHDSAAYLLKPLGEFFPVAFFYVRVKHLRTAVAVRKTWVLHKPIKTGLL